MGIESSFTDIQRSISQFNAKSGDVSDSILSFEDAYNTVMKEADEDLKDYFSKDDDDAHRVRNKATLRSNKHKLKRIVEKVVYKGTYDIEGYDDKDDFIEDCAEEILGRSVLAHAFEDPDVSDIFCIEWDNIWVEKKGRNQRYVDDEGNPITFRDADHYENTIKRILQFEGKEINQGENKIVDSTFYEDRIAVTDKTVSPKDYSMTIRKHKEDHITLQNIIDGGTFDQTTADLLGMMVRGEMNMIYAGITGSGKTTSIRAVLDHYVQQTNKRMLVAEDTQELFPRNPHTVELKTVKTSDERTNVSLRDLIILSLRLKPKYIVVGEVRGPEAEAAVEGMATGHSTIFTMHGGNAWDIINRLITKYLAQMPELSIEVVERTVGNAVDYIAVQDDIPGIGRRLTSIKEVSYDFENRTARLIPIVEFDFETRQFIQINKLSPAKTDYMMRRGVPYEEVQAWMRESADEYVKSLEEYKRLKKASPSNNDDTTEDTDKEWI